jgi:hypothetical protein
MRFQRNWQRRVHKKKKNKTKNTTQYIIRQKYVWQIVFLYIKMAYYFKMEIRFNYILLNCFCKHLQMMRYQRLSQWQWLIKKIKYFLNVYQKFGLFSPKKYMWLLGKHTFVVLYIVLCFSFCFSSSCVPYVASFSKQLSNM